MLYYVVVTNGCGSVQSSYVTVYGCAPPLITQQPHSVTTINGAANSISVAAIGSGTLVYQWYYAETGAPILSRNQPTFDFPGPGSYYAIVYNNCGSVQSDTVTVTFCDSPTLVGEPNDVHIAAGQTVTLGVTAFSTTPMTFQWYDASGNPIPGATSDSLTVSPAQPTSYAVNVTNSCASTMSRYANVFIDCSAPPEITSQPQSVVIAPGQSATLSVATTTTNWTILWYADNGAFAGGGSSITVSPSQTTGYYAVITTLCGSTTSSTATVTVGGGSSGI